VQACRNLLVLERQRGLDQSRHTGGDVEMSDIGLHRPDGAKSVAVRAETKRLRQSGYFNRISEGRCRAMSFNVGNRFRVET